MAVPKSEVERKFSTYLEDAATMHQIARDVTITAEQRLARVIKHAKADTSREILEEIKARGIDLLDNLEEARDLEKELTLLVAPDEGGDSGDKE